MEETPLSNPPKNTTVFFETIFCLVVISFLPEAASCQSRKIDSLRTLASSKTNSEYSYVLPELAFEYVLVGDYKHAVQYAEEALHIAYNIGDSLLLVCSVKVKA